jgi:hypothetical protein
MSNENVVHTENYKGYTINILPDDNSDNPRSWDNAGKMVCWHRRYTLGDEQPNTSPEEWIIAFAAGLCKLTDSQWNKYNNDELTAEECWKIVYEQYIFLPLNLYDHSGISMSTCSFVGRALHAEWDSGQVGWIYISKLDAVKEWGKTRFTKTVEEKATNYLVGEVKTYDDYLRGNVYGYQVCEIDDNDDGEVLESCWGFYPEHDDSSGYAYCLSEAKDTADWLYEQAEQERQEAGQVLAIAQAQE